ncbi:endonuclease/exonuclease/phosphatase family protein [Patescibacteria group bacterium]|nr:MAG: endonuclease/exonuclease/phosphatase family protein [Patescibacteria group bacterium]
MKLISLNIEGAKHLARVCAFLEKEDADVLCVQEIFERDAEMIARKYNLNHSFSPMLLSQYIKKENEPWEPFGICMFSKTLLENVRSDMYWSPHQDLKKFDTTNVHTKRETERHMLLSANVTIGETLYTVATTHFTWTPDGQSDSYQETDTETLLHILEAFPEVILCGDFNLPRNHNPLYEKFSSRYIDAIPPEYTSSLDLTLHRMGNNPVESSKLAQFMVDYLFLTPQYHADNVHLESGVSDHMAVVADIKKI